MEYFPSAECEVTILFEVLRHGDDVGDALPHLVLSDVAPGGVWPPTCQEGVPAGTTQCHLIRYLVL